MLTPVLVELLETSSWLVNTTLDSLSSNSFTISFIHFIFYLIYLLYIHPFFDKRVDLMLREAQMNLVDQFMDAVRDPTKKGAAVHQLIMGSGKTTVVAPLLALMLADGKALVVQVKYILIYFLLFDALLIIFINLGGTTCIARVLTLSDERKILVSHSPQSCIHFRFRSFPSNRRKYLNE